LSDEQLKEIDTALLSVVGIHYRKVAMVVAMAMGKLGEAVSQMCSILSGLQNLWRRAS